MGGYFVNIGDHFFDSFDALLFCTVWAACIFELKTLRGVDKGASKHHSRKHDRSPEKSGHTSRHSTESDKKGSFFDEVVRR